ncbi:MAG: hypothetical protein V1755_07360 [Chloroflexota bacterium]
MDLNEVLEVAAIILRGILVRRWGSFVSQGSSEAPLLGTLPIFDAGTTAV